MVISIFVHLTHVSLKVHEVWYLVERSLKGPRKKAWISESCRGWIFVYFDDVGFVNEIPGHLDTFDSVFDWYKTISVAGVNFKSRILGDIYFSHNLIRPK